MSYQVKPKNVKYLGTVKNSDTVTEAHLELYQGFRKVGDIYFSSQSPADTLTTFIKDKDGAKFYDHAQKFYHSNRTKTVVVDTRTQGKEENYILWYSTYLALNYFDHKGLLNKIEYYTSGAAFGLTYSEFSAKDSDDSR